MKLKYILLIIFFSGINTFSKVPEIGERQDLGPLTYEDIDEASGIIAGINNLGILWTHNDSGNDSRIFALNDNAGAIAEYYIQLKSADRKGLDWEDISIYKDNIAGKNYLVIGDIGDNDSEREVKRIILVEEPLIPESDVFISDTIDDYHVIYFTYPDGKRDSEAMFIDPVSNDLIVISKREDKARVYRTSFPESYNDTITLEYICQLPFGNEGFGQSGVVAADISSDGKDIIIKTYFSLYYYSKSSGQSWAEAFAEEPASLTYTSALQEEALCWKCDDSGYYTLAEEIMGITPHLYFYSKEETIVDAENTSAKLLVYIKGDEIIIETNNNEIDRNYISLYDYLGRQVDIKTITSSDGYISLSKAGLQPGVYYLVVRIKSRYTYGKISVYR